MSQVANDPSFCFEDLAFAEEHIDCDDTEVVSDAHGQLDACDYLFRIMNDT